MTANDFIETHTLKDILRIPPEALDYVMAKAYQLHLAGHHPQVEVLCRGLIAADHRYWWSYSLYAAALHKMERHEEALVQLDRGLAHEPLQPKLLVMRAEILAAIASLPKTDPAPVANAGQGADQVAGAPRAQLEAA